jgi:hypothetical protein
LRSRERRVVRKAVTPTKERDPDGGYRHGLRRRCRCQRGTSLGERLALGTVPWVVGRVLGRIGADRCDRGADRRGYPSPMREGRKSVQR